MDSCISVDLLSASATANISVHWKHEKLNEVKEHWTDQSILLDEIENKNI